MSKGTENKQKGPDENYKGKKIGNYDNGEFEKPKVKKVIAFKSYESMNKFLNKIFGEEKDDK